MKKILVKNKNRATKVKISETKSLILKSINQNSNFFILTRLNAAFQNHSKKSTINSSVSLSSKCLRTINKKRFTKLTFYSRHLFLKIARIGLISGLHKSIW